MILCQFDSYLTKLFLKSFPIQGRSLFMDEGAVQIGGWQNLNASKLRRVQKGDDTGLDSKFDHPLQVDTRKPVYSFKSRCDIKLLKNGISVI